MFSSGSWSTEGCFNSRPHEEVDTIAAVSLGVDASFNSRPHEEVDRKEKWQQVQLECFNSRPHEEVDRKRLWKHRSGTVSTHDLTKRSTDVVLLFDSGYIVSTHDLTKRSTTATRGVLTRIAVSTHDLTKRSTSQDFTSIWKMQEFQLTTSRRGRRCNLLFLFPCRSFNSRPHEEVDRALQGHRGRLEGVSTHDLTKRSTSTI